MYFDNYFQNFFDNPTHATLKIHRGIQCKNMRFTRHTEGSIIKTNIETNAYT